MLSVPDIVKIKISPARKKRSPNLVIQKAIVEDLIASESLFQKPIRKYEDSPNISQKIKLPNKSLDKVKRNIEEIKIVKKRKYLAWALLSSGSTNLDD
jgi:hypothetical protein